MRPVPRRFRLWESSKRFVRSCLPVDRRQLVFVGALVCLSVAPHLRWTPTQDALESLGVLGGPGSPSWRSADLLRWHIFLGFALFPIPLVMFAGYWIAFWPGERPARRLGLWVLTPALLVWFAVCVFWLYLVNIAQSGSIFEARSTYHLDFVQCLHALWGLGAGLHFLTFGILLMAGFYGALIRGKATLPLTISHGVSARSDDETWQPMQRLSWTMLGPQSMAFSALAVALFLVVSEFGTRAYHDAGPYLDPIIEFFVLVGIARLMVGKHASGDAWRAAKLREPLFALLGASLPVLITLAILIVDYLPERAEWAAQRFGDFHPPAFFPSGAHFEASWLVLLLGAFAEELVFRGILQPHFVRRYGLLRGLVLLGILWGAFHFPSDHHYGFSDAHVLWDLVLRVAGCLAMGLVLGWLTIRCASILPATLAHGVSNIMVFSWLPRGPFDNPLRILIWGLAAYILFTRFPVRLETGFAPEAVPSFETQRARKWS